MTPPNSLPNWQPSQPRVWIFTAWVPQSSFYSPGLQMSSSVMPATPPAILTLASWQGRGVWRMMKTTLSSTHGRWRRWPLDRLPSMTSAEGEETSVFLAGVYITWLWWTGRCISILKELLPLFFFFFPVVF